MKVVTHSEYESTVELLHRASTSHLVRCYMGVIRVRVNVVTKVPYESDRQLLHVLSTSHYDCCYRGEVRIKDKLLHDKK